MPAPRCSVTTSRTKGGGFYMRRRDLRKSQHQLDAETAAWERIHQQSQQEARMTARQQRLETEIPSELWPDRPGTLQELRGLLLKAAGHL